MKVQDLISVISTNDGHGFAIRPSGAEDVRITSWFDTYYPYVYNNSQRDRERAIKALGDCDIQSIYIDETFEQYSDVNTDGNETLYINSTSIYLIYLTPGSTVKMFYDNFDGDPMEYLSDEYDWQTHLARMRFQND